MFDYVSKVRRACCPAPECPLLAISRHSDGHAGTSALPPKADITAVGNFRRSILAVLLDEGVAAAKNVEDGDHSFSNVLTF